jgi:hypothetical protein
MSSTIQKRKHFLNTPYSANALAELRNFAKPFFKDLNVGESLIVYGGDDKVCIVTFGSIPGFTFAIPEDHISVEISEVTTTVVGTLSFKECSERYLGVPFISDETCSTMVRSSSFTTGVSI